MRRIGIVGNGAVSRAAATFADQEQFRVLFLDKRNQLIADELQQVGTVDHYPGLPARNRQARAGIVRHRVDPGAQSSLRRSDAVASRYPEDQIDHRHRWTVGIAVHDHIIVGKNGHASLKGIKLI
jgi:DNA repair protein RadC